MKDKYKGKKETVAVYRTLDLWLAKARVSGRFPANDGVASWVNILRGKVERALTWDEMILSCNQTLSIIPKETVRDEVEVLFESALNRVKPDAA